MRSPELEMRHRKDAVLSRMFLNCNRLFVQGYTRDDKSLATVWPELLVLMAIRDNDERGLPPICISDICTETDLKRGSVQRWLKWLIKAGAIVKVGDGYIGDDGFLIARLRCQYFKDIIDAVLLAGDELRTLM